jgi:lysophospholipase L1-like esterase
MMKKVIFIFAILLAAIFCLDFLFLNQASRAVSPYRPDDQIGWIPKENFHRSFKQKDLDGKEYDVQFFTYTDGFRAYGDIDSNKVKILIVGDSFTGDPYTGNDDAYFSVMKKTLRSKFDKEIELFVIGASGYGTLQEFLIIERYAKRINPDILVLQFCSNDFGNNSIEIENNQIVKNQSYFRPYFVNDNIVFNDNFMAKLYRFIYFHSRIIRRLDIIKQRILYYIYDGYGPEVSQEEGNRLKKESISTTKIIMSKFSTIGLIDTKFITFNCDTEDDEATRIWKDIALNSGFLVLETPSRAFEAAEKNNRTVRHADGGHLNILGNKITGEELAAQLAKYVR